MKPSDLPALAIFARVVEQGGFTAASKRLAISKSAVSKAVAALEDRLGVRLFNRTTRRLSLTEAGEAFYAGCLRMLAEAAAAEQAVTYLAEAPRGLLRVNLPMSFGNLVVAPHLATFLQQWPELSIDATFEDRRVDLITEGYDLAVRIGVLDDSSLIARRLCAVERVLCAAPGYLERTGTPQAPEALAGHDCLLYAYQASGDVWHFRRESTHRSVRVRGRLRLNSGDALVSAGVAGLGLLYIPTFIVASDLRSGRLVRVLPDWTDAFATAAYAVYPAARNLSPKVRAFIDHLVAITAGDRLTAEP